MKIVVQAFLLYITFISVIEKNEIVASVIPEQSRGVWTDFKKCLLDKDDSLSRGIWTNFKACLKDEDDAESRGLWSAFKALLLDKNEDEAEELFKQMDATNRQTTRGLWTNFKQCLMDKDDSLSRGIWTSFKECLKDEDNGDSRGLWSAFMALLKDKDEAEVEEMVNQMVDSNRKSSNNAESRGFWTNLLMKLVSDKDDAESRWGFSFGIGFDKLADTLLEDVDEAKAEAIIKEFVSKNSNAESRAFWVPLLGSVIGSLLSDKDNAQSRWGFGIGFSFDKLADTLLEDVDDAKAEAIIKEFVSKNSNAESRAFWVPLLGSVIASMFDKDDAQSRGLWTNFKNCLKDKDDSLSRGIWTDFKACLKDQDIAESRWGFSLGFSWDKLVDTLLEDVDEAKAEAIIKEFASTNNNQDDAESRWGFNLGFSWDKLVGTLLEDVDEAKAEAIINNLASTNNAESRGFWTNLLMKLVSDKDDAESRWGFNFGLSFDKLADTLLEDVDEAKAEAIIKEFVSKNSAAESRGLWTNFKNCLKDKDDSLSRGIWTDFKACLKDQDDAESRWGFSLGFKWDKLVDTLLEDLDEAKAEAIINKLASSNNAESRGFWTNLLMKLVSDKDDAESRWGFGLSFKWDKLVDTLLEDVDEAKAEAIIKELATTNNAESRGFWTNLLMKLVSDKDDAESRGLWTNFKQCLMDKDDSLSRGIWSDFKSCLKDQDLAESRGFWTNLLMKLVSDHDDEA